jgi:hypothetical protein
MEGLIIMGTWFLIGCIIMFVLIALDKVPVEGAILFGVAWPLLILVSPFFLSCVAGRWVARRGGFSACFWKPFKSVVTRD